MCKAYNSYTLITLTLCIGITLQTTQAHIPEEAILRAEHALTQDDFATANTIWQEIAPVNTRACFNAGVYALHNGDIPTAHAYFTRAAADNTYKVRLAAIHYLYAIGAYSAIQMVLYSLLAAPPWFWVLLALLLAIGALYQRSNTLFSGILRVAYICGIISSVYYYQHGIQPPAVILRASTMLSGPDNSFTPQATVTAGQIITILKQHDAWALVHNGSHTGWIARDHIIA